MKKNWQWQIPSHFNMAVDLTERQVKARGADALALEFVQADGRVRTFTTQEILTGTREVAAALLQQNVEVSDRVVLQLPNCPEYALSYLAALYIGAIPVPASVELTSSEIDFLRKDSGAKLVIQDRAQVRFKKNDNVIPFDSRADDPAYLVYTSGSTDYPKGVLHAHRALMGRDPAARYWAQFKPGDKVLHAGKLNWTFTLGVGFTDPLRHGASVLLTDGPYDPEKFLKLISRFRVSHFIAVPTVYRHLLRENINKYDLRSLKICLSAGEMLPAEVRLLWKEKTGLNIYEGMGMSEISYYVANFPGTKIKKGSCGRVQPGHLVRVVNEDMQPVAPHEEGQIVVRGDDPGLMLGYWRRDMKKYFRDGYFLTGDSAVLDEEGYLTLMGRRDEIISSFGFRISPFESERILRTHHNVREAATVGWESAQGKTIVISVVEKIQSEQTTDLELIEYCEKNLARYKSPKKIIFTESLPRTRNGKIKRAEVTEWARDFLKLQSASQR